jgi:hypothetical protein
MRDLRLIPTYMQKSRVNPGMDVDGQSHAAKGKRRQNRIVQSVGALRIERRFLAGAVKSAADIKEL